MYRRDVTSIPEIMQGIYLVFFQHVFFKKLVVKKPITCYRERVICNNTGG